MAHALWTIGHSTRNWETFVALLQAAEIKALADVRRFAGSRRHPQFSGEVMARELPIAGIAYAPMPALGGRRPAQPDSPNTAWRNASFRGYADYMATDDYLAARARLEALAIEQRVAVMCAEALWWQCHRGLIADDFKSRGRDVVHLLAADRQEAHPYTAAARIVDGRLDYRAAPDPQPKLFE